MGLFITALGLMMIIEGIPCFCFPDSFKNLALKIADTPDSTLRTLGLIIMIVGLGLVYLGRNMALS